MNFTIEEIKKISLKSNDILVIKVNKGQLSSDTFTNAINNFRNQIKDCFPNNNVIFCDESFEFIAISKEET